MVALPDSAFARVVIDRAIHRQPDILRFLIQAPDEPVEWETMIEQLAAIGGQPVDARGMVFKTASGLDRTVGPALRD